MAEEKTELSVAECLELAEVIKHNLDGRAEPVSDNNGKVLGIVIKPYKIDGKSRYNFAKTLRNLRHIVESYEEATKDIETRLPGDEHKADRNKELRDLLKKKEQVELFKVAIAAIHVDDNQIPSPVITALLPMLTGEI